MCVWGGKKVEEEVFEALKVGKDITQRLMAPLSLDQEQFARVVALCT